MKKRKKYLILFIMIIIGIYISYKRIEKSRIEIKDKELINIIKNINNKNILNIILEKTIEKNNPIRLMNNDYKKFIKLNENKTIKVTNIEPVIYLYNTHQTEEYSSSSFAEFSVNPTVVMNNYILEDVFNKYGYKTYVEEELIKDILNNNKWNYSNSYKASRILLEKRKLEMPSLKYFIDIHRDSIKKDKTTIEIDNKPYAKILFIVGLENKNYQKNLAFTEKIHYKINEKYPNLSKGIYKKGGEGVNGVYNQDFSEFTILVEMGGFENTTNEVLNSAIAFSECFMEVLNE